MKKTCFTAVLAVLLAGCGVDRSDAVDAAVATAEPEDQAVTPYVDSDLPPEHSTTAPMLTMPMWETLPEPSEDGYRHLEWEHLMPPNFAATLDMSNLDDAPVVEELNGELIRIPGYVLPLDTDMERVYRFLIVPYVGACVHVPPPPSNQLIYAQSEDGMESAELWEAVFIYGTLTAQSNDTEWGTTGYVLDVDRWEPYVW